MKKLIAIAALSIVAAFGLTGCVSPSGSQTPAMTQEKLAKTAILLKGSVRSSLILVVDKNGTNAQAYVCASAEVLNVILGGTNYTPGLLESRLLKLPIKELKKSEVQLIVSTLLTAYELYYADYVNGKINGNMVAVTLLTAIRDGVSGACSISEGGSLGQ